MSNIKGNVLLVDDEIDVGRIIADALIDDGYLVTTTIDAESAFERLAEQAFDLAFVDINLPGASGFDVLASVREQKIDTDVVVVTGRATVANAIEATRRGAYDYVTKPFDLDKLVELAGRVMEGRTLSRRAEKKNAERAADAARRSEGQAEERAEIVGQSGAMQAIYKTIGRVAGGQTTVLVEGESGTGKEVIARAIHAYSDRAAGPFVAVNCSAIPADLLESEMFGHERGAFTGATERRSGKFEQAKGGTLFLDEIGDMPLPLQAKLLRVLQEREFSRVGGHELLPAECRIITATNKTIEEEVEAGRFREDLYFRLKVVVIELPPLRERREDIPLLVDFFLARINAATGAGVKGLGPEAMALLVAHSWPGNVRELENVLLRAAALTPNRLLTAEDIPLSKPAPGSEIDEGMPLGDIVAIKTREYLTSLGEAEPRDLYSRLIAMIEKPLFQAVLDVTGGNQVRAAEILGINRNTLRKKITDYDLEIHKGNA